MAGKTEGATVICLSKKLPSAIVVGIMAGRTLHLPVKQLYIVPSFIEVGRYIKTRVLRTRGIGHGDGVIISKVGADLPPDTFIRPTRMAGRTPLPPVCGRV